MELKKTIRRLRFMIPVTAGLWGAQIGHGQSPTAPKPGGWAEKDASQVSAGSVTLESAQSRLALLEKELEEQRAEVERLRFSSGPKAQRLRSGKAAVEHVSVMTGGLVLGMDHPPQGYVEGDAIAFVRHHKDGTAELMGVGTVRNVTVHTVTVEVDRQQPELVYLDDAMYVISSPSSRASLWNYPFGKRGRTIIGPPLPLTTH